MLPFERLGCAAKFLRAPTTEDTNDSLLPKVDELGLGVIHLGSLAPGPTSAGPRARQYLDETGKPSAARWPSSSSPLLCRRRRRFVRADPSWPLAPG